MEENCTKRGPRCGATKLLEAFARRRKIGRQSYCKECRRAYQQSRPRVLVAKTLIRKAKGRPCADCGIEYPYHVMDLDHRPGTGKLSNFNVLVKQGIAVQVLEQEIAKCDVVCSNCPPIRTYKRKQNYTTELA